MSVLYYYSMTEYIDQTANDIVLVGNASNFLDGGRVEYSEGPIESAEGRIAIVARGNSHGFKFLSADANLSIGGNYTASKNILYQAKRHYQETAAVKYAQNGTVYFSAQTGSPGTGDTSSSGIFNPTTYDYKINIDSSNTWDTRFAPWKSTLVYILSGDSSNYSFLAEKKLTVGGDFYGTVTSTSRNTSTDFSLITGTTITPWNTSLNNKADSAAFFARTGNFVLKNNFRGTIVSTSKTNMRGFATPTVTGNTAIAYGIFAGQDVLSEAGVWSSTGADNGRNALINITSNNSILEAVVHIDGDPNKDFAVAVGTDKPVNATTSAVLANNKLAAIAVKAGNGITVRELRDFNINGAADNNRLYAEATLDNGTAPSVVSLDNNVIESIGFDGVTLNFGLITSGTTIDLSTSNNSFLWSANKGVSGFDNNLSSIGFRGTTINLGRFEGNINITVDGNVYDAQGYFTSAGFVVTTMNSNDNLYGSISVTNQNNYNDVWATPHRTLNMMYGIKADNMNVNGIIYSNITINAQDNNNNGGLGLILRSFDHQTIYGIRANRFYGEAFAGNITINADQGYGAGDRAIGIQLSSDENGAEVMTRTAGDAVDINGSISVHNLDNRAYGVLSYYRLNLRVSGTISATTGSATHNWAYAIRGDLYCADDSEQTLFRNDIGNRDIVEIAAGARITGKINLGANENNIIISSQAALDGGVENGGGKDNIKFMLDGAATANPIVIGYAYSVDEGHPQRQNESSLTSGSSITINLNNAVNKETYTLYRYVNVTANPDSVWGVGKTREVTIEYQGISKTIFTRDGYGAFDMSTDSNGNPTGLTANGHIQYSATDKTVKIYVDNVIPPVVNANRSLSAQTVQNSKNVLLAWTGNNSAGVFEVEYKINGGKSIVVKLAGDKKQLLLENIDYGAQIEWKIRENIGNGSQLSGWNQSSYVTYPVRPGEVGPSPSNPKGSNPDSSETGITAAIAKFAWEKNNSPNVVEYYEIEYFESELLLSSEQLAAKWDNPSLYSETSTGITKKTTTATELIVSGLTNQRFIYWRTRASYETVNNDGSVVSDNKSNWQNGDLFRVWVGDYSRPTFIGTVSCTPVYQGNGLVTVNFDWSKAVADDPGSSGVKKFVIYYKKVGDSWTDADAVKSKSVTRGDAASGADFDRQMTTISDIGTGMYEWRVTAVDYVGNESVYQYGNLFGDNLAPVFEAGPGLALAFNGNNMTFSWNAASDVNSNSVAASGLAKYQLTYNYVDNDGRAQTRVLDVDKYSTSITVDGLKQLAQSNTNFTWSLSALDVAGNRLDVSDGKTILIDKTPPAGYPDLLVSPGAGGIQVTWSTPPPGSGQTRNIPGSASFSISWTYIGAPDPSGIFYEVQFSNDKNFLSDSKSFSVVTNQTSITFNDNPYFAAGKVAALGSGTVYWRIKLSDGQGNTNGNYTIHPDGLLFTAQNPSTNFNWEVIKDTIAPTIATNLSSSVASDSINVGKSKLTLQWAAAYDGFGVKEYQVKVTSKNGYSKTHIVDGTQTSLTIAGLDDGDYTWTVNTVDHCKNQSGYTDKQSIAVNTNPPKPVEGLFSQGFNSEIYLTWAPQQSAWAFDHYSIGFALKGSTGFSWTQSKTNSLMLAGLTDGEYEYFIFAEDKAGNQGDRVTGSFRIDSSLDLSNSRNTATRVAFNPGMLSFQYMEASYTVDGNFTQLSTVGLNDKEDSMIFNLPKSSRVGLNLTVYGDKAYGKNSGVTATVYNSRGKKVKSFTVKNGFGRYDVLLDAVGGGDFYITLNAKNKKGAVAYDLVVDRTDYDIHNDDDNWQSLSGAYVKNYDTSSDYQYLARTIVDNENGSGTANWIGFGDLKDYRKVTVNTAGKYNFVLRGLVNKARITVFALTKGKLKKIKAVTGKIGDVATGNLLIDSLGAGKEYYVLVEGLDGKKDKNSNYTVDMVTDVVFNRGINADDSMDQARAAYRIPVTANSTYQFRQYAYNNSAEREWIGFGDAVDYRYIGMVDSPVAYSFRVSGLQDKTKVSVGYLVNGKFVAVKTLTGTAAKNDLSFNGILNKTGYEYFLKVEAPNAAKGSSSDYILEFNGTALPPAKSDMANDKPVGATQLAANVAQTNYVGYGDLRDYFAFNVQNSGRLDLSGLTAQAKVTLFSVDSATGKLVQLGAKGQLVDNAIQFANLATGNYQLLIEAADKGKTQHSYFTVGLTE